MREVSQQLKMAADIGWFFRAPWQPGPLADAAAPAHSSLNLTPDEKRLYGQLFQQADTDGLGVVTGDVAVQFFEKTKLDQHVLGAVCDFLRNLYVHNGMLTGAPHRYGRLVTMKTEAFSRHQASASFFV